MKIDLLTIFPGIVLETQKWDWGKEVKDTDAYNNIVFNNTHIISYKKLQSDSGILNKRYLKYIDEIHPKIIDSNGSYLTDYTIVLDKNIESKTLEPPTPDSQQLITYFSYLQHLDIWISIDFIKILCFHGGGRHIYLNNQNEHWSPKYSFLLPIEQNHKGKLKISKNKEKSLIDVFSTILNRDLHTYKRLINAIALFNESCRINSFSPNSSIVLIASAFEGLLNIPRYSKKENFAYALKIFWGFDERIEQWAKELYELRSQIVHGDVTESEKLLASKDCHYPHFKIARDMFHDCLSFILESYGYLIIDKGYKFEVIKRLRNQIISNKEKVNKLLSQKERFSYQAFVNNKDLYKEFILKVEGLTPTDYSAQNIIKNLLKLIFAIAKDWIQAELRKDYGIPDKRLKEYLRFRNDKFSNILKLFNDIRQIKWSLRGKFQIYDKIGDLEEEVRQLEPIVYKKDEFNFTLPEFFDRCLRAMFAVY